MNRKLTGVVLLIVGCIMAYFAYRGIYITKDGMINVVVTGALAGACFGGAFSMLFGFGRRK